MGPIDILLVEDNPADQRLIAEAFAHLKEPIRLHFVNNGLDALSFLRGQGEHANTSRPSFIFLDLNLPGRNGLEILKEIKSDPNLKRIPVVIFTSSQSLQDIEQGYSMHANCFVSKPFDIEEFFSAVQSLGRFWIKTARLPDRSG